MTDPTGTLQAQYRPGGWVGIAGPRMWLLADVDPADPVVGACWALIQEGAGADHLLGALLSARLRRAAHFALARLGDGVAEVVVRGLGSAALTTSSGDLVEVRDTGGLTERSVPGVVAVCLQAPAELASPASALLHLGAGVVQAGSITVGASSEDEPTWTPLLGAQPLAPSDWPRQPERPEQTEAPAAAHTMLPPAEEDESGPYATMIGETIPPTEMQRSSAPIPESWFAGLRPAAAEPSRAERPPSGPRQPVPQQPAQQPDQQPAPHHPTLPPNPPTDRNWLLDEANFEWARVVDDPRREKPAPPSGSDLADELAKTAHRPSTVAGAGEGNGQMVNAVRCHLQHLNPPAAYACRVCASNISVQIPAWVRRPVLGVLRLSTGDVFPLDRGVVMGRAPGEPTHGGPHHLKVPSPDGSISRRHLEVVLDGWQVEAVDLGSTNGSTVSAPGGQPERLQFGARRLIEPGWTVHLDAVTWFRYEVAP